MSKYDRLIAKAREAQPALTVVVHPCDETSLRGAIEAAELGLIKPILVGPAAKIASVAAASNINLMPYEIVDVPHSDAAAARAVELIHQGRGEVLMKGSLHTDELMRAVTSGSNWPSYGAPYQPRVHYGRSDIRRDNLHHGCRHQYCAGPRC